MKKQVLNPRFTPGPAHGTWVDAEVESPHVWCMDGFTQPVLARLVEDIAPFCTVEYKKRLYKVARAGCSKIPFDPDNMDEPAHRAQLGIAEPMMEPITGVPLRKKYGR